MTTQNRNSKEQNPVFEEAFTQLHETVDALEGGGLSLEEATRLFDQGMRLAKTCNELLSATELKISRLQRSFGEQMAMMQEPVPDQDGEVSEGLGEQTELEMGKGGG
jgi:exodeoxyribonuclease VII small subunit